MKQAGIYWLAILSSLLVIIEYAHCQPSSSSSTVGPTPEESNSTTIVPYNGTSTQHVIPTYTAKYLNSTTTAPFPGGSSMTSTVLPTEPTSVKTTKVPHSTTQVPSSSSITPPTKKPHSTPKPKPGPAEPHERHFDTASFFGGIILASGLIICGYLIWRFYKNRKSYHHL